MFLEKALGKVIVSKCISVGIGIAVGPYVGAYIKDVTGGYYWAQYFTIIRLCGTAFAIWGLRLDKKQQISVDSSIAKIDFRTDACNLRHRHRFLNYTSG